MAETLYLNSNARSSGTASDFRITLDRPIRGVWKVLYAAIPHSLPTVPASTLVVDTGSPTTISLPAGYYTPTTLASTFQTLLQSSFGSGFTCVYDVASGALSFAYSSAFTLTATTVDLAQVLGLTGTTASSTTVSTGVVNLSAGATPAYFVTLGDATDVRTNDGVYSSFILPVNSNSLEFTEYRSGDWGPQYVDFRNQTSSLQVRVTDSSGAVLTAIPHDWFMILTMG